MIESVLSNKTITVGKLKSGFNFITINCVLFTQLKIYKKAYFLLTYFWTSLLRPPVYVLIHVYTKDD